MTRLKQRLPPQPSGRQRDPRSRLGLAQCVGASGRSGVRDELKPRRSSARLDKDSAAITAAAKRGRAECYQYPVPDKAADGQSINTGSKAVHAFAGMRIHALESHPAGWYSPDGPVRGRRVNLKDQL